MLIQLEVLVSAQQFNNVINECYNEIILEKAIMQIEKQIAKDIFFKFKSF